MTGGSLLDRVRESLSPHHRDWPPARIAVWGFDEGLLNREEFDEIAISLGYDPHDLIPPEIDDEAWSLANDKPRQRPWRPENDPSRQRTLFSGLDCLPGQRDLFDC